MSLLDITLKIPTEITKGLANGALERVGGVVRDAKTKKIVMWLRETSNFNSQAALSQIGSAASILNLGVSVVGFAVVVKHLNEIEGHLQEIQKTLNKIDVKLDLRYYAEFRAALKSAAAALSMKDTENRKKMAIHAIDGLTKAEQYYLPLADVELEQRDEEKRSKVIGEYLLTLMLCYIAEARCYLELVEPTMALERLQEGELALRPRVQKYIELLLTSNPAAYLHPSMKDKLDLRRLTKVYQWLDPESNLDEVAVFEMQRENLFSIVDKSDQWVKSLSFAIFDWTQVPWGLAYSDTLRKEAYKALPGAMDTIESMVETYNRFEAYQMEVKAIEQLGISFHDWLQLAPQEPQPEGSNLMYIIPAEPLSL